MTEHLDSPQSIEASVLDVRDASKRYGDVVALDGVSLRVDGGIYGLLGANGAGKSTLMKAIVDLVPLDAGTVWVRGVDSARDVEARRRVGYLPEELRLYDRLTFAEYLELADGLRRAEDAGGDAGERREWLEWFDLWRHRDVLIAEGSLGMRKKIGLAAALIGGPELVILDEPLNGLDTESMRRLRLRMAEMVEGGATFVVSSHVMAFVERVCEQVAILRRGRLVAAGSPETLRAERTGLAPSAPFEDVFLALAVDDEPGA